MKQRNLIFAILWAILAIAMLMCGIAQWYAGEYFFTVVAAMAFGCDAYSAWTQLGHWLEYRKQKKKAEETRTREEVFAEYDKFMEDWKNGFPEENKETNND